MPKSHIDAQHDSWASMAPEGKYGAPEGKYGAPEGKYGAEGGARPRPTLAQPITVEWWKNRRGESIRVTLSTWEGRNVIDVRTWYTAEGRLKPGKGFCAEARHLPQLVSALTKACSQARELHLIPDDHNGGEQ